MVKILDEQPEFDVVAAYQDRRGEGKVLSFFKKSSCEFFIKIRKFVIIEHVHNSIKLAINKNVLVLLESVIVYTCSVVLV